jgi:hypothetical protein
MSLTFSIYQQEHNTVYVILEFLRAVVSKIQVWRYVMLCRWVHVCPHLEGSPRNEGKNQSNNTVSRSRKRELPNSLQCSLITSYFSIV